MKKALSLYTQIHFKKCRWSAEVKVLQHTLIQFLCNAPSAPKYSHLVLLFHSAAQALGIDYIWRVGEEGRRNGYNVLATFHPQKLFLHPCPCLFCSRDLIGLDGRKPWEQEMLTHSVMSDVCTGVIEMSSGGGSVLDLSPHWHNHSGP